MGVTIEGFTLEKYDRWEAERFKAFHVAAAERALTAEVARNKFPRDPVVITDGRPRKDYNDVKLFGVIEFAARPLMKEAVEWALTELQKRSPVHTGRYAASHVILINGAEIKADIANVLAGVKPTDRIQIVNPQPYAKKIEGRAASKKRGISGVKGLSGQARGGVYRVVHRLLMQRYGRSMFFDFKYMKLNLGVKVWGFQGGGHKRGGKYVGGADRKRIRRDHVYPVLNFFIKGDGPS
ncbi:hypothetical protein [Reyranella sp.]|uniref:hypothetical protein n=1 Tax=Reyranella sp. TaxID=1929291 RepID=UPI002730148E|nr:hypothetical protein [Reyranella sp.]MDP2377783.1 hypothetical protein [Reyranella sp.]